MKRLAQYLLLFVLSAPAYADECEDYFKALHAFTETGSSHFSEEWDALIEASEAVKNAIEDEDAANALNRLWELRRARSAATIALGFWAYPPDKEVSLPFKSAIQELHRRGQDLSWELQSVYQQAVQIACLMRAEAAKP